MPLDATRNSLVLPLLGLLVEHPAHAYDLTTRLHERYQRGTTRSTVTTLLKTLERNGLVAARAPEQVGNRPPRTVYEPTAAGLADFRAKVESGLVDSPAASVDFTLAVAYVAILPADRAATILEDRATRLDGELDALRLPPDVREAHMLEVAYWRSVVTAEITWTRATAQRIRAGELDWPDAGQPHPNQQNTSRQNTECPDHRPERTDP
ncbi:PadR family transcriptional regulator [Actinosynnema sp. NPDC023587]|uniref:PadR family transcriptional regulator n=1 Tax=Actinosynnema sp. NPDC023587 TaxID=3154695 RepID=UPI0033DA1607